VLEPDGVAKERRQPLAELGAQGCRRDKDNAANKEARRELAGFNTKLFACGGGSGALSSLSVDVRSLKGELFARGTASPTSQTGGADYRFAPQRFFSLVPDAAALVGWQSIEVCIDVVRSSCEV
jgi:hypothetical protein